MEIKIVRAVPRDAYVLSVLAREYFDYAQLSHDKILERLKSRDFEYWLARIDGKIAGFIDVDFTPVQGFRKESKAAPTQTTQTQPKQSGLALAAQARRKAAREKARKARRGERQAKQAKILGLAVLPEFRGKGIAKKLVAKAAARAKARGCKEIFLLVQEDNAAAQSLYSKLGFVRRGVLAERLWSKTIFLFEKNLFCV